MWPLFKFDNLAYFDTAYGQIWPFKAFVYLATLSSTTIPSLISLHTILPPLAHASLFSALYVLLCYSRHIHCTLFPLFLSPSASLLSLTHTRTHSHTLTHTISLSLLFNLPSFFLACAIRSKHRVRHRQ